MHTAAFLAGLAALVLPSLATPLLAALPYWDPNHPQSTDGTDSTTKTTTTTTDTSSGSIGTVTVTNACAYDVGMHVSSGQDGSDYDDQTLSASGGIYSPAYYGAHFGGAMATINNGQSLKFWPANEGEQTDTSTGNEVQMEYTVYGDPDANAGPLVWVNYDISVINGPQTKITYALESPGGNGTIYTNPTNGVPVTMPVSNSMTFTLCPSL